MPSKTLSRSKRGRATKKAARRVTTKRGRRTAAKAAAPRRQAANPTAASMAEVSPTLRRELQKLGVRWQALLPQLRRTKSPRRARASRG